MTNSSYYPGGRSFMSADLKRHAHAVRCAVDAKSVSVNPDTGRTINPRAARLVHRASIDHERPGLPLTLEAPTLTPRARHALAWGVRGNR